MDTRSRVHEEKALVEKQKSSLEPISSSQNTPSQLRLDPIVSQISKITGNVQLHLSNITKYDGEYCVCHNPDQPIRAGLSFLEEGGDLYTKILNNKKELIAKVRIQTTKMAGAIRAKVEKAKVPCLNPPLDLSLWRLIAPLTNQFNEEKSSSNAGEKVLVVTKQDFPIVVQPGEKKIAGHTSKHCIYDHPEQPIRDNLPFYRKSHGFIYIEIFDKDGNLIKGEVRIQDKYRAKKVCKKTRLLNPALDPSLWQSIAPLSNKHEEKTFLAGENTHCIFATIQFIPKNSIIYSTHWGLYIKQENNKGGFTRKKVQPVEQAMELYNKRKKQKYKKDSASDQDLEMDSSATPSFKKIKSRKKRKQKEEEALSPEQSSPPQDSEEQEEKTISQEIQKNFPSTQSILSDNLEPLSPLGNADVSKVFETIEQKQLVLLSPPPLSIQCESPDLSDEERQDLEVKLDPEHVFEFSNSDPCFMADFFHSASDSTGMYPSGVPINLESQPSKRDFENLLPSNPSSPSSPSDFSFFKMHLASEELLVEQNLLKRKRS